MLETWLLYLMRRFWRGGLGDWKEEPGFHPRSSCGGAGTRGPGATHGSCRALDSLGSSRSPCSPNPQHSTRKAEKERRLHEQVAGRWGIGPVSSLRLCPGLPHGRLAPHGHGLLGEAGLRLAAQTPLPWVLLVPETNGIWTSPRNPGHLQKAGVSVTPKYFQVSHLEAAQNQGGSAEPVA